MGRVKAAVLAGALLWGAGGALPTGAATRLEGDGPAGTPSPGAASLEPAPALEDRLELESLLFPRAPPARLLKERLRISGIDPEDVRRTLEDINRRSEIAQFTPDGLAVAPYLFQRALNLQPGTLLQVRFSGRAGKLVFRFTWP